MHFSSYCVVGLIRNITSSLMVATQLTVITSVAAWPCVGIIMI